LCSFLKTLVNSRMAAFCCSIGLIDAPPSRSLPVL
jgi:hypothetical protein